MSMIMSPAQVDVRSVESCVSAVVTAFVDATQLINRIKAAGNEGPANDDLDSFEDSLMLGPPIIQGLYEDMLMRVGDTCIIGDQSARETLKDIVINLQLSLLATLRMALLDNIPLDYRTLQTASDNSRVNSLLCLYLLGQRLKSNELSREPVNSPVSTRPAPSKQIDSSPKMPTISPRGSKNDLRSPSSPARMTPRIKSPTELSSPVWNDGRAGHPSDNVSNFNNDHTTPSIPENSSSHPAHTGNYRNAGKIAELVGSFPTITEGRENSVSDYSASVYSNPSSYPSSEPASQGKSKAPTSTTAHRKSHSSTESKDPQPSTITHQKSHRSSASKGSLFSQSTKARQASEGSLIRLNSPQSSKRSPSSIMSSIKWRTPSIHSKAPTITKPQPPGIYLPREENKFSGFCKGAWKLQNEHDKAFRIDSRPIGISLLQNSWHCTKCDFEGPIATSSLAPMDINAPSISGPVKVISSGNEYLRQTFEQGTILHGPSGNRYRWIFLAKHHAPYKAPMHAKPILDGKAGSFGCIFCCSKNSGPAPIFGNLDTFMEHLREHGGRGFAWDMKQPSEDLLDWAKCIIGRVAMDSEDFDINIPSVAEIDGST